MLFNCFECAKTISTKMDKCPYCCARTAQVGVTIETAVRKEGSSIFDRFKGTVANVVLKAHSPIQ